MTRGTLGEHGISEAIIISAVDGLDIIEDEVGMSTAEALERRGIHVVGFEVVGDEKDLISGAVLRLLREPSADVVLVLSGSGGAAGSPSYEAIAHEADSLISEDSEADPEPLIGMMGESSVVSLPYDLDTVLSFVNTL